MIATLLLLATTLVDDGEPDLRTVAERSGFTATARDADVIELGLRLAKASPLVQLAELGKSGEGRSIPLWIVADPPIRTPEQARSSGKLVALLIGNIHAGEVDGKEGLPMLVRALVTAQPRSKLLDDVILVVIPDYNVDGNERVATTNRPGQIGPEQGMGERTNAAGLDLNRDYMKLDAPETRALVKCMTEWDPHLFFDAHTTNGSHHRYTMTYEGPKNLAGDARLIRLARDRMFPELTEAFGKLRDEPSFFYGNFEQDHTQWTTFPATPRFGTTYVGLRNRMSILSEAYSYSPYKTRVLATRDFANLSLQWSVLHRDELRKTLDQARQTTIDAGNHPRVDDLVPIRSRARAFPGKIHALGYVEAVRDGKNVATAQARDYEVDLVQDFEPTVSVPRPRSYLIPPGHPQVIANLKAHGIVVKTIARPMRLEATIDRVDKVTRSEHSYEGHHPVEVEVTTRTEMSEIAQGTSVVPTGQPLGSLVVYLLEPRSDDGLLTWNFFDDVLKPGSDFPIVRSNAIFDVLED